MKVLIGIMLFFVFLGLNVFLFIPKNKINIKKADIKNYCKNSYFNNLCEIFLKKQ